MHSLSTALDKATNFVGATIQKVAGLTKPQRKFFIWLSERWLMLPVRYNFLSLFRYGGYCERAIRQQFSRKLPFLSLFHAFFEPLQKRECIAIFDPSFVSKSGKQTYGLGKFWSGTAGQLKQGIEVSCLAIADVADGTAYSMEVVQTPVAATTDKDSKEPKDTLVHHYGKVITERAGDIRQYSSILAVDGYFMKQGFISVVTACGLTVITKGRQDADMRYLYKGAQKKGKGRKKVYDGKVNWKNIDKRKWKKCREDKDGAWIAYEAVLYSIVLKRKVKVVHVEQVESGRYELLVSTDEGMKGDKVLQYYRLRFQIEFLIRDAKGHTGLEHCQARSEEKLYNHFNMAMMSVSVIKYQTWAKRKDRAEVPFSMRSIKTWCFNRYLTETIFSNLDLDRTCHKIKRLYNKCLHIGCIAA